MDRTIKKSDLHFFIEKFNLFSMQRYFPYLKVLL